MEDIADKILSLLEDPGRDSLIPILQEIQNCEGWLSEDALIKVGNRLGIPVSKIYGVATFYNQFRFRPKGMYHIQVCRGTACHVLGSSTVLDEIKKTLRINTNETTKDGMFSLEIVACIGTCGLAPVICINGNFHAGISAGSVEGIIKSYREQALNNQKNE